MKESNYIAFLAIRLFTALLPLALGWPLLAFCFCAYNLVMVTATRGGVYGGIVSAATALAGGLLCFACGYGAYYGIFFALQLVVAATFCSLTVITRKSFGAGLLAASVGYGLGNVLNLKHMANNAGLSIADYIYSHVEPIISQSVNTFFEQYPTLADGQLGIDPQTAMNTFSTIMKAIIPASLITGAILAGYIVMWMVSRSLRDTPLDSGHSFANIRLSVPAVVFGAVMLALLFVPGEMVSIVGLSGVLVFINLAFFSGLSLMEFLLRRKIKNTIPRVLIHIAFIAGGLMISAFFPLVNIFLLYALMGIIDCFASIRKRVIQRP